MSPLTGSGESVASVQIRYSPWNFMVSFGDSSGFYDSIFVSLIIMSPLVSPLVILL